jgi:hypothetical protein
MGHSFGHPKMAARAISLNGLGVKLMRRSQPLSTALFTTTVLDTDQLAVADSAGVAPFRVAGIPCPFTGFQPQNFLLHLFVVLVLEHLGLLLCSQILSN